MATELGQAYVQIIPSARGIGSEIYKELDPQSTRAGRSAGGKIVGAIKGVIAVAAIGKFIGNALTAGGELQQSLGGIETLFKENADKVKQYASEAYKTSGLSANDYMTSVTSFSASLLQSLGGDTEVAADKANSALIDMSDNANKMGTDMESIQETYQGFAKQNYTMLDNLKLGYGGTKTEMERLLTDATKLSGVKYDISNLADVYDAIHVVQTELDITGTTAKESAETFSGSLASMKSAYANVMGNLALGTDLTPHLQALAQTLSTFLFGNFLPMIGNIISALPGAIVTFIQSAAPLFVESGGNMISQLASGIITGLPTLGITMQETLTAVMTNITENLPLFLSKGSEILINVVTGILQAMPKIIESAGNILSSFVSFLMANLPVILKAGGELLLSLVDGIIENLPAVVQSATKATISFIETVIQNYPQYLQAGTKILMELVSGIIQRIPQIINTARMIISELAMTFISKLPDIVNLGKDIARGIWEGIKSMGTWLAGKASDFVDGFLGEVKGFLGIHSPSKVFQNEVGKNIVLGIAKGITENEKTVIKTTGELSEHILSEASKWVDDKKFYNQLSLDNELDFWKDLKSMEGLQGEELKEIDKRIYSAKQAIMQEESQTTQKVLDDQKRALDEYQGKIDSRVQSLLGFAGIFDKIESDQEVSGKELLSNLKGQVNAFKDWQLNMDKLASRGVSGELLSQLQSMGPKAAGEIQALTELSGQELQKYVNLFAEKGKLAAEQAEKEMGGLGIELGVDTTAVTSAVTTETLNMASATIINTLNTGIGENMFKVSEVAQKIADEFVKKINDSIASFYDAGRSMVDGLWDGIDSGKSGLINNIVTMLKDAVKAAKEAMDINSPSKVWAEIGGFMSEGLGVGFVHEMQNTSKQISGSIPKDAVMAANYSINGIGATDHSSNITKDDGGIHLHIENMVNSDDRDIHDILRVMEFYRQQKIVARGGLA